MTIKTQTAAGRIPATGTSTLASAMVTALLGVTLLFLAGHAQSAVLHQSAHDVRHATGFPCH